MGPVITLCTDFGTGDGYVAAMKGVILSIAPRARLVDISHDVARQSVAAGAFVLRAACHHFPPGTVHLAVIDPEVGGPRRALAVRTARHRFVAPDNGLLSYVLRDDPPLEAVALTREAYWREEISRTFHGRDIFAPAAAHLANGVPLSDLGEPAGDLVWLDVSTPTLRKDGSILGHVIHVDHYGNIITDIPARRLAPREDWRIVVGKATVAGLSATYIDAKPGQLLALIGSHGNLEVAIREGDAARLAGIQVGAEVWVR